MGYVESILMETSEADLVDLFTDTRRSMYGRKDRSKSVMEDIIERECDYNETVNELRRCYAQD